MLSIIAFTASSSPAEVIAIDIIVIAGAKTVGKQARQRCLTHKLSPDETTSSSFSFSVLSCQNARDEVDVVGVVVRPGSMQRRGTRLHKNEGRPLVASADAESAVAGHVGDVNPPLT